MSVTISARGITKTFRLGITGSEGGFGSYRTLRETLSKTAAAPLRWLGLRPARPKPEKFVALEDVSFDIHAGEAVGIIGRNGAGKSTLLKILSRISCPSRGEARIRGRVGSLLEVGTSFHPELTGRENIFLNGAVLGMTRREIGERFSEITAFAEIDRFLDTPVKRYSSGMFIRLAFSVAAHLECEVLLIDEVLAVGDAAFQKKCLGRMESGALGGRTIVFVSHNMSALQRLCSRVIWLDRGRVVMDGPAGEVVGAYLRRSFAEATVREWPDPATAPGSEDVRMRRACVRPTDGTPADPISIRTPLAMEFDWWNLKPGASITLSVQLCNSEGTVVFRTTSIKEPRWHGQPLPEGLYRSRFEVPGDLLNDGTHFIEIMFRKDEGQSVHHDDSLLTFEVLDDAERRGDCHEDWPGAIRIDLPWTTEILERASGEENS